MHVFIQEDSEILIPTLRVVKAGEAAFSPAEYDTGYTIRLTRQGQPDVWTKSLIKRTCMDDMFCNALAQIY